jgi:hypothetical protein
MLILEDLDESLTKVFQNIQDIDLGPFSLTMAGKYINVLKNTDSVGIDLSNNAYIGTSAFTGIKSVLLTSSTVLTTAVTDRCLQSQFTYGNIIANSSGSESPVAYAIDGFLYFNPIYTPSGTGSVNGYGIGMNFVSQTIPTDNSTKNNVCTARGAVIASSAYPILDKASGTFNITSNGGYFSAIVGEDYITQGSGSITVRGIEAYSQFDAWDYAFTYTSVENIGGIFQSSGTNTQSANIAVKAGALDSTVANYAFYAIAGDSYLGLDNAKIYFGTGFNAYITYNGTNFIVEPDAVGTGYFGVQGNLYILDRLNVGYASFSPGQAKIRLMLDENATYGMEIDGTTTPYTSLIDNPITFKISRTYNQAAGTAGYQSYGAQFVFTNTHVLNGTPIGAGASNYNVYASCTNSAIWSIVSITPANDDNYGIYGIATRSGTQISGNVINTNVGIRGHTSNTQGYNSAGNSLSCMNYGGWFSVTRSGTLTAGSVSDTSYGVYGSVSRSGTVNAGTTLVQSLIGGYFSTAFTGTMTGTATVNSYGVFVTVGTTTGGTNNAYGVYISAVATGDTNYGFYNNSTAGHNLLGKDNVNTYFGTGLDSYLYYDGTNTIFKLDYVGSGYFHLKTNQASVLRIGDGAPGIDYYITFAGETTQGTITYMEDESRYDFTGTTVQTFIIDCSATPKLGFLTVPTSLIHIVKTGETTYGTSNLTNSITLENTTAATAGVTNQYPPGIYFKGHSWDSSGGADIVNDCIAYYYSTYSNPHFRIAMRRAGGSWLTCLDVDSYGQFGSALKYNTYDNRETLTIGFQSGDDAPAAAGYDQYTPVMRWMSKGWKTDATAGAEYMGMYALNAPEQGAAHPIGVHKFIYSTNSTNPSEANELFRMEWGDRLGVVFNEVGASTYNFRVEGDTDANLILTDGATNSVKLGGATTSLIGFYGVAAVDQPATVSDPAGGATVDAESRTAINAIIDRLQELGLIA